MSKQPSTPPHEDAGSGYFVEFKRGTRAKPAAFAPAAFEKGPAIYHGSVTEAQAVELERIVSDFLDGKTTPSETVAKGEVRLDWFDDHRPLSEILFKAPPSATPCSEWIPVADRMPGNYATVLIVDGDGISSTGFWNGSRWTVDVCEGTGDPYLTPTHWMPLPAAPKLDLMATLKNELLKRAEVK